MLIRLNTASRAASGLTSPVTSRACGFRSNVDQEYRTGTSSPAGVGRESGTDTGAGAISQADGSVRSDERLQMLVASSIAKADIEGSSDRRCVREECSKVRLIRRRRHLSRRDADWPQRSEVAAPPVLKPVRDITA
jgi:hypothetical protein